MNQGHAANIAWSGIEAATAASLSFASAFIVARLVGPSEVGVAAAVVSVHVLLWVVVNALFADALVQRAAVEETTVSSALWASVVVGAGAAGMQAVVGWPLAAALGDPRLQAMSAVLALPLPLVGAAGPIQGLLTRDRAYRALACRTFVGQGLGTVTGIAAALTGAGAWAMVLQQLVVSLAGALALLLRRGRPKFAALRWQRVREMLRLGLPLTTSTLVQHGRYRLFALLIGGTAGAAALGQVHMAFRLVDAMRELAFTALWRLMLPILSERQDDLPRLRAAMDRCLAWSGLVAFPACGALAVSIQPLVGLLLGPVWQPAGFAALPLVALSCWLFLTFPSGVAVVARGVARYTLIANLAGTLATVLGVLLVRPATPVGAVAVWLAAQVFVSPYVLHANARILHVRRLRPLRAGVPPLGLAMLATLAACVLPRMIGEPASPVGLIAVRLAVGAAVYLPGAALLLRPAWLDRKAAGMAQSPPALSELRGIDADL